MLRLESLPTAMLVGVTALPLTVMGGQAGILQGERRWGPLSAVYLASGLGRLVMGGVLIAVRPTEFAAMLGVAAGAYVPVVIGWWALRRRHHPRHPQTTPTAGGMINEAVHNSHALLAFFALSNADVVMARAVLDGHQAGLYAAGLIMTKAVLFLPQFVVVIAFPSMSTMTERRRALTGSLGVVAVLGAVTTAGALLLPQLALVFVGGDRYQEIADHLWIYAILGTVLSMLQLLVYSVLARQGQRSVYLVWAAFVAMVGLGLATDTLRGLLTVVIAVDAVLLAALLAVSLHVTKDPVEPEPAATSS